MTNVDQKLRELLRDRTQRELAFAIGISDQNLNAVLNGHRSPGPKVLSYLGIKRIVIYVPADYRE